MKKWTENASLEIWTQEQNNGCKRYIEQGYRQVQVWQSNVTYPHNVIYPLNRRWVTPVNTLVLDTVLLPGVSGKVTPAARISTTYNDSLFTRDTLNDVLIYCMIFIGMYFFFNHAIPYLLYGTTCDYTQ